MAQQDWKRKKAARRRRAGAVVIAIVLVTTALLARYQLFSREVLFGPRAEFYANLATASVVSSVLLLAAWIWVSNSSSSSDSTSSTSGSSPALAFAAAAVALPTAAVAAIQVMFPATPYDAAAPACAGAPVLKARFLGQTVAPGVNARDGAGTGFPNVDRYGGSCTLGFDGFCIGEPVVEKLSGLEDTRWYIVHGRDHVVSSSKIRDQSPVARLAPKPDADCESKYGGLPAPDELEFTPSRDSGPLVKLSARAEGASLVGYAVYNPDPRSGTYGYSRVGIVDTEPTFDGTWDSSTAVSDLRKQEGTIYLGAAICLAAEVPFRDAAVFAATYRDGRVVRLRPDERLNDDATKLLRQTACSTSP
ncbi:hypothetical protein [Nocardioides sp.]|uniref:hypothetical protein n=1 Tax=Nocardioides sp. TaxID=35761 RepID=UPI0035B202C5